jgi:hypothetical protein
VVALWIGACGREDPAGPVLRIDGELPVQPDVPARAPAHDVALEPAAPRGWGDPPVIRPSSPLRAWQAVSGGTWSYLPYFGAEELGVEARFTSAGILFIAEGTWHPGGKMSGGSYGVSLRRWRHAEGVTGLHGFETALPNEVLEPPPFRLEVDTPDRAVVLVHGSKEVYLAYGPAPSPPFWTRWPLAMSPGGTAEVAFDAGPHIPPTLAFIRRDALPPAKLEVVQLLGNEWKHLGPPPVAGPADEEWATPLGLVAEPGGALVVFWEVEGTLRASQWADGIWLELPMPRIPSNRHMLGRSPDGFLWVASTGTGAYFEQRRNDTWAEVGLPLTKPHWVGRDSSGRAVVASADEHELRVFVRESAAWRRIGCGPSAGPSNRKVAGVAVDHEQRAAVVIDQRDGTRKLEVCDAG